LLAAYQQILADTVTLYKALGGGWPDVDVRNSRANTTADAASPPAAAAPKAAR